MPADDPKDLARSGKDFYAALELNVTGSDSSLPSDAEVRKAYRKLALKYHPDKNAGNTSIVGKFHELQIAFDVLSDPEARAIYDHEARTKRQAKERDEARRRGWSEKQKRFADALEVGEREGSVKRARTDNGDEDRHKQQFSQLRSDYERKLKEKRQSMQQETAKAPQQEAPRDEAIEVDDLDRAVKVRWETADDGAVTEELLRNVLGRFGDIELAQIRKPKRRKDAPSSQGSASVVFKSVASALIAVEDVDKTANDMPGLISIVWQKGKPPTVITTIEKRSVAAWQSNNGGADISAGIPLSKHEITRIQARVAQKRQKEIKELRAKEQADKEAAEKAADRVAAMRTIDGETHGLRKVPSFASFKKGVNTPQRPPPPRLGGGVQSASVAASPAQLDPEQAMLREQKRREAEEALRRQEAEEDRQDGAVRDVPEGS